MNISAFLSSFEATMDSGNAPLVLRSDTVDGEFTELINRCGGKTFNSGIYRVLRGDQVQSQKEALERVFPEFAGRIVPFGYDWLGRHFAIDFSRLDAGQPQILMMEVGAGEAMQIPATISAFHNVELVEYTEDVLALNFFQRWRSKYPSIVLKPGECVGYKVPLFLGGEDEISNLEVIDLSVYVEICGQLRNKVRNLKPGQTIGQISIAQ